MYRQGRRESEYDSIRFIYCNYENWNDFVIPAHAVRDTGLEYRSRDYKCNANSYIKSIRIKEDKIKVDNLLANYILGIELACSDDSKKAKTLNAELTSNGAWSTWTDMGDQFICGERELSGYYGIMVKRSSALLPYTGLWGKWSDYEVAENGYFAC